MMEYNAHAYNAPSHNSNYVSNDIPEAAMAASGFSKMKPNYGGMKLIFEFPPQSFKDDEIKMEVRAILTSALQEQLQKTS